LGDVHEPQLSIPPHSFGMDPQFAPSAAQVVGVQPHTLAVPPPPQVLKPLHEPQLSMPPQPFGAVPQLNPRAMHVVGVQPQTRAVPPPPHVSGDEQPAPQAPQFVSVLSGVSQPFASFPSQLPYPVLQVWMAHVPVEHVAVARARVHGVPQAPQFVVEVSAVSQPFESFPSQLPWSELHMSMRQLPVEHVAVAFEREHVVPHMPQLSSMLSRSSHPFASPPSQLPKLPLQPWIRQVPPPHVAVAFARLQEVSHDPQLPRP
jgi:hypothetical protein